MGWISIYTHSSIIWWMANSCNWRSMFKSTSIVLSDLSMNGLWSHSDATIHASIYLGMLLLYAQNFMWQVNHTSTLASKLSYPFANNSFTTSFWVAICRNLLYCIVFGSKHINASIAQKHLSPMVVKQQSRWNNPQNMIEQNESITLKAWHNFKICHGEQFRIGPCV